MKNLATPQLKRQLKKPPSRYSQGFTLLEILVAIVVLSFGLLGMVGIQAMALKSNNDAKQQSAAVQLAGEYSDMMRGNKSVAVGLDAASNPYLIADYTGEAPTNPPQLCNAIACTTALNVAQWEKFDWLSRIRATFPGAHVVVCYDTTPYTSTGLPQWPCTGAATANGVISIKIGWTRQSTNSDRSVDANGKSVDAFDLATGASKKPPSVIYTVTPGSSS
jgi:type IV pilus assembly protein PilV